MIAEGSTDDGGLAVGLHPGVCVVLASIGPQDTNFGEKKQVILGFELPLSRWESRDGRSGSRMKWMRENIGLGSPSMPTRLRRRLEEWREKRFTGDEALAFDLEKVLGLPVGIEIVHNKNERTGRVYEDINRLCRVQNWVDDPEGAGSERVVPEATEALVYYDFNDHDEAAWELLPGWIQDLTPVGRRRKALNNGSAGSGSDAAAVAAGAATEAGSDGSADGADDEGLPF
jgi:hypothetical protein